MNDYLALVIGIVFAGLGGELFIKGSVGLARCLRVSASVIGVTFVAFATSSPELSVAISSAISGRPEIALGDALGSNILNVALILGIALALGGLRSTRKEVKRNISVAFLIPVLIGLLSNDGMLSRIDGLVLFTIFLVWITLVTLEARRQRYGTDSLPVGDQRRLLVAMNSIAGLILLVAAGRFIVLGASGIAEKFGLSSFVIGAVIVSIGTSVPELATTLVSKIRGHDDVGLNTILGSNIFNGLFIIATAAIIHPITVNRLELLPVILFGILTIAFTIPTARHMIDRWRGFALLALYIIYVLWTL
ncbi:MAG: sodium:calcium antiporter [Armatimonadota bacterium]